MAALYKTVDPIRGNPSPYGLLGGCVEVVTATDMHELGGTQFQPVSCATASAWRDPCVDPTAPATQKIFDRPGTCQFEPINIYAGVTCGTFGMTYEEGQERALEQLRLGEQRALEEAFMVQMCAMAAGNDLTPASGAVSVAQGVAMLEGWLADRYGGAGVVHAPAAAAALFGCCNVVTRTRDDSCPETLFGSGVVFGAGYDSNIGGAACAQAPACEAYLFVTPPVRVRRDERHLVTNSESAGLRYSTNDRFALAETSMVVETACCVAAMTRVVLCP